jgi:hypothetical protein
MTPPLPALPNLHIQRRAHANCATPGMLGAMTQAFMDPEPLAPCGPIP